MLALGLDHSDSLRKSFKLQLLSIQGSQNEVENGVDIDHFVSTT